MIIPKYARYDFCIEKACMFLEEYDVIDYPVDPFEIIKINKWGLMKYSELSQMFNCSINDVCLSLGSNDGFTIHDENNYTIAYNDSPNLGKRIVFTLFHEIGHIYLNHLIDFEHTKLYRGSLTKKENKVLENEANAFARNVSAPAVIITRMEKRNEENVATYFNISEPAAKARLDLIGADVSIMNKTGLYRNMNRLYYRFKYKKRCSNCDYFFIHNTAKHCPICSSDKLKWGKSEMLYSGIKLSEFYKALICPVCGNDYILKEGEYCHICGTHLVNRCTNTDCEQPSMGNARYCILCGCETTFNQGGILKDWRKELQDNEVIEKFENNSTGFENEPFSFEINEELPFN